MVKTKIKDPELIRIKQRQICQGALKVFRTKGFHAASIREIATASGISLGSLYDYIEKKDDILFLVHKEILDQVYRRLDETFKKHKNPVDQLTNVVRELVNLTCRLKDEMLFIYTETKFLDKEYQTQILHRESEFVGAIEALIKRGVKEGLFDCPNPDIMANIIAFTGAIIPLRGWNFLPRHSEDEVIETLVNLISRGLDMRTTPAVKNATP